MSAMSQQLTQPPSLARPCQPQQSSKELCQSRRTESSEQDGSPQETPYRRMIGIVNQRFATFNILDVDYMHYKGDFFQARCQKQQLLKAYTQKNWLTIKTYAQFSKAYQKYQWKPEDSHTFRRRKSKRALSIPTRVSTNAKSSTREGRSHSKVLERSSAHETTRSMKLTKRVRQPSPEEKQTRYLNRKTPQIFKQIEVLKTRPSYHLKRVDLGNDEPHLLPVFMLDQQSTEPNGPPVTEPFKARLSFSPRMVDIDAIACKELRRSPTPRLQARTNAAGFKKKQLQDVLNSYQNMMEGSCPVQPLNQKANYRQYGEKSINMQKDKTSSLSKKAQKLMTNLKGLGVNSPHLEKLVKNGLSLRP